MLEKVQIAYPQTVKILGNENLTRFLTNWNGTDLFHDYLRANQSQRPYLADLALLEFLLYKSYTSESKPFSLDMDGLLVDLEKCPQEVVLEVSSSLFLLQSKFPIQEIWQALKLDQQIDQVELRPGDYHYIINTVAQSTGAYLVSPIIYQTVELLQKGPYSLNQVVMDLFANAGPAQLQKVLQHILSSGWIERYHLCKI